MRKLIQELVSIGADISTRKALKSALKVLGAKPENIDKIYIELKNSVSKDRFVRTSPEDTAVFLPQCLRNSRKCKAKLTDQGYICRGCGACKIAQVKKVADKLGHRLFVVPGGSMVLKLIKQHRPRAVVGVACLKELTAATEEVSLPSQGIELLRDGCLDTDVNLKEVLEVLNSNNGFGQK